MDSRQRILNTIAGRPVDRVPISLYELCQFEGSAYASFANHRPSYCRVMKAIKNKTDCIMQTATPIGIPLSPVAEENLLAFIDAGHEYGKY